MFVRINSASGVKDFDVAVAMLKEKVLPALESNKGFRGLTASGNTETGDFAVLSLWETEEDLDASESAVTGLREETMETAGGSVTVTKMEQIAGAVGDTPPAPGCLLRIVSVKMDPARVDEQAEFFRSQVLPGIKASPGFRGARNMIDRKTGIGNVGTIWADEESLKANEKDADERRERARAQGVELGEPQYRTILFTHLR